VAGCQFGASSVRLAPWAGTGTGTTGYWELGAGSSWKNWNWEQPATKKGENAPRATHHPPPTTNARKPKTEGRFLATWHSLFYVIDIST
jgi:hypothetical protein